MKYLKAVGICSFVLLNLWSCGDDKEDFTLVDERDGKSYRVISAGGLLWMAEDLELYDNPAFSYQQSLDVCPPGWSMPTEEDWVKLSMHYGGYVYNGDDIGNPSQAYSRMRNEFNAPESGFYWTSTPAWQDAYTIRSSMFAFTREIVEYGANLISAKFPCRCVKRQQEQTLDALEFTVEGGSPQRYDFYSFQNPETTNGIVFIIHKRVEDPVLVDRISFFAELPATMLGEGDVPIAATEASINSYFNDKSTFESEHWTLSTGEDLELHFTFYDGQTVRGTFSGTGDTGIAIEDGSFEFTLK